MTQNKLKKCLDCQGIVSKNADKCPHCGAKLKSNSLDSFISLIVAVIIIIIVLIVFSTIKVI
jgi:uncharacterized paraquat-inducible protein A